MHYQLFRKTLGPSNRQVHQGMIAIVDRLVVLSVFMLVVGVTSTTAKTGQDERCADFTGKAKRLCMAAVSEGCFDGVDSQACNDLTTKWDERCRECEGTAPWEEEEAVCPCAEMAGSAVEVNAIFEDLSVEGEITSGCIDDDEVMESLVSREGYVEGLRWSVILEARRGDAEAHSRCIYV